jgi:hypothetical protein
MSDNDLSSAEKEKTSKSDVASTEEIPPEVFDSSTYNSMTDLKTSATMNESETNTVLSDIDNKEPIEPKQLDKQTVQISKKIGEILQPLQKHIKSVDKQSELIKQLQSQLKQLQKQVSQIQKAVSIGKKKQKR